MLAFIFVVFEEKENGKKLAEELTAIKTKLTEDAKTAEADINSKKALPKFNENSVKLTNAIQVANEINKLIEDHVEGATTSFKNAKDVEHVKKMNEKGKQGAEKVIEIFL